MSSLSDAAVRVLYLAPPVRQGERLSRYSFLDEEIRAIADRGVHTYVLAREGVDRDEGCVHVRVLPGDSVRERRQTLGFFARNLHRIPARNLLAVRQWYRTLRVERFAAELVEREGIALIHSYFGWPRGFGGYLAAAVTERPLVAGIRGADINTVPSLGYGARLDPSFDRTVRQLLRRADRTIFVSDFLRRQGYALGARPEAAQVVLKGVRLDQFRLPPDRGAARQAVGAGPEPMILSVAGLVPIKGLKDVLDALGALHTSGRRFSFMVCGAGPEREALQQQASRLGLGDRTVFLGKVSRDRIAHYFAAADVMVHGAVIEASGNVLLEAMASGLPVVCTDAGGPAEYVTDGISGFVVPVADPAAMAEKIGRLLDDPVLRQTLGSNGRLRAVRDLAYDRMIDDTLDAYGSLLGPGAIGAVSRSTAPFHA